MKPKWIAVLILAALFIIVLLQNTRVVTYRLFFWKLSVSQIILLPMAVALGVIIGFLIGRSSRPLGRVRKIGRNVPH